MTLQPQLDALSDDAAWRGGWYQPIIFPDGSRTHSTKLTDAQFYSYDSFGLRKWERAIHPNLPCPLEGARFLEIGCNAGLYLAQAHNEGAVAVYGVENHSQFIRQARFVLPILCPEAVLIERDALAYDFSDGPFDLVLMANALYWMVYSDERGFLPDAGNQMARFLRRLACSTRHILVIGCETSLRYGSLGDSWDVLREVFDIIEAKILPGNDRTLNVVTGRSRYC